VVEAEAAEEAEVGDDAAPALADGGGAREGGRLRGEAEEDLGEQVVVVERRRRRAEAEVARDVRHLALLTGNAGFGFSGWKEGSRIYFYFEGGKALEPKTFISARKEAHYS
jgi:hypothetical protein